MFNTNLVPPTTLHGWGEGHRSRIVSTILNNNNYELKNPKIFSFVELPVDSHLSKVCTPNNLRNKNLILTKLAARYETLPNNTLIIETHEIFHENRPQTYFRFHQAQLLGSDPEYSKYVRNELPIRNPWTALTPGIFYQQTIKKTMERKQYTKDQAQQKVNNLLACLFNSFDLIVDLANRTVYKRKLCLDLANTLKKLRHLDTVVLFDQMDLRQAIIDKIELSKIVLDFDYHSTPIEFYDCSSKRFKKLNKDAVELNGVKHLPYVVEHNYILVVFKFIKPTAAFVIHIPSFEKKYLKGEDVEVDAVIPFYGINNEINRLREHYLMHSQDRVVGKAVASLNLPLSSIRKKTDL